MIKWQKLKRRYQHPFHVLVCQSNLLTPNIIHSISPTKQTQVQNVGYIAQLNSTKTEITNVYLDRKQACFLNDYETSSALDTPVKEFSCKYDCIRTLKISDKTLAKALKNNTSYNNYYFKEIGSKLKCV